MIRPSHHRWLTLIMATLSAGCATAPKTQVTRQELAAQSMATTWQLRTREIGASCTEPPPLSSDPAPMENRVRAGYVAWSNPNPSGCLRNTGIVYRGAVAFVLPAHLKRVSTAIFEFRRVDGSTACAISAYPATASWTPGYQEGFLQAPRDPKYRSGELKPAQNESSLDVTNLINEWVSHGRINNGFVLIGENETYPDRTARCVSELADFRLRLEYGTPQTSGVPPKTN